MQDDRGANIAGRELEPEERSGTGRASRSLSEAEKKLQRLRAEELSEGAGVQPEEGSPPGGEAKA